MERDCVEYRVIKIMWKTDYCLNLVRRKELDEVKTKMCYMSNLNAISKLPFYSQMWFHCAKYNPT
jgi:hypothetical protein